MIHSTFSPAAMPAKLLERTFVQREALAERLTDLFVDSALTDSKHNVLLVGPRGIGKSHLVSLVYHRLLRRKDLYSKLSIAYLHEDEWGVSSFLDLLVRILAELGVPTDGLEGLSAIETEKRAEKMLRGSMRGRTLLVILENLDTVLRCLGENGQRKWRAFIQNSGFWSLLATAPLLSEDIADHASPFYGFFEIQSLEGLSVPDAAALLRRLAESQGKDDIAKYLSSPAGRARVRAVQHLANGNHRIFVIFYEFLARDKEADLVEPILKTIDALTPYYQSQMRDLSPQQRKLVGFLCRFKSAANVKTIAASCHVSHQTAASQLKQLLKTRFLRVTRTGRESYYELNEPLLRICVEVKLRDGQPIRLLVEFLRYWFSRQELSEKASYAPADSLKRTYLAAALREYDSEEGHVHLSPDVERLCMALSEAEETRGTRAITTAAEELAEVSKIAEDWAHYTRALSYLGRAGEALGPVMEALETGPRTPELVRAMGMAYEAMGRFEPALSAYEEASSLDPHNAITLTDKGDVLSKLGRNEEALNAYMQAEQTDPSWYYPGLLKGNLLVRMRQYTEAEQTLKVLLKYGDRHPIIFSNYACALAGAGELRRALRYFLKAKKLMPTDSENWRVMGHALLRMDRPSEAITALRRAWKYTPEDHSTQVSYCIGLFAVHEYKKALGALPVDIVAHQLFHEFLSLTEPDRDMQDIEASLLKFQSTFADPPGPEVLAGALTEFISYAHVHAEEDDMPQLRKCYGVITKLFSEDPNFEILISVFGVMLRYKESGDEKTLLELPLEQRRLLEAADKTATS